jgi:hemolysin activation/secretion protein
MNKTSIIFLVLLFIVGFNSKAKANDDTVIDGSDSKTSATQTDPVIDGSDSKTSATDTLTQHQTQEKHQVTKQETLNNDTLTQHQAQEVQEKHYRDNMKTVLEAERARDLKVNKGELSPTEDPKSSTDKSDEVLGGAYKFDEINLIGNKIYSYKNLKKAVLDKFIGKPINRSNIKSIKDELFNYYAHRGYFAVGVGFDTTIRAQKVGESITTTFTYIIYENKVGKILLKTNRENKANDATSSKNVIADKEKTNRENKANDATSSKNVIADKEKTNRENKTSGSASKMYNFICDSRRQTQILFAAPFMKENPLNLRDLEQAHLQMNRLKSNSITIDVLPGTEKGYSDVILKNNQNPSQGGVDLGSRTTFFNLNYSNSGQKLTGQEVINLNISQDNLLSINDNIYISYTESADSLFGKGRKKSGISYTDSYKYETFDLFKNDDKKERFKKSLYGNISFPFGYQTFNASLSYSTYKATQKLKSNRHVHSTGKTLSQEYGIDRVIYSGKRYKLNLGTGLEVKDSRSFCLENLKPGNGIRSNGSVYLNNTILTDYGMFIIKPTYKQGLSWFGAKSDKETYEGNMTRSNASRQYKLVNLFLYFNRRIDMPLPTIDKDSKQHKKLPMMHTLAVNSQYSFFNALHGEDRLSIGGEHTVRGYKDSIVNGDDGVYTRQDLRVNMFHLMPDVLTKKEWAKNKKAFLFGESLNTILSKTQLCGFYDMGYVSNKYDKLTFNDSYMIGTGISLSYSGKYINSKLTYSRGLHCPQIKGQDKEKQAIYWTVGASW